MTLSDAHMRITQFIASRYVLDIDINACAIKCIDVYPTQI